MNWKRAFPLLRALIGLLSCAAAFTGSSDRALAQPTEPGIRPDRGGPSPSPPPEAAAPGSTWIDAASLADSLVGQPKADYDAGRILFQDQDYPGALVKFQRAFDGSGDIRLLWNMAVCEKNLRRYARVLPLVERYWREGRARMSEAHRDEVSGVLETVRTLISRIHLDIDEPGATVSVDDIPEGTTPLAGPLLVDLGTRRIRISKPGFKEQTVVQHFTGGSELTIRLKLEPEASDGQLTVSTDRSYAISIDGKIVGTGGWQGTLPAGEHTLRVAARDRRPYEREVVVNAGESRTLYVTLDAEDSGIPGWVWIGAGVLVAGGLATGGYFLFRPEPEPQPEQGTLLPGVVYLRP